MDTLQLLRVIEAISSLLDIAANAGVDLSRLSEMKRQAKEEGRDLSDDDLTALVDSAQASIDATKEA